MASTMVNQRMLCAASPKTVILVILDHLLLLGLISPLIVFYWRGLWHLIDTYFFPTNPELSAWVTCIGGHGIVFWLTFSQDMLKNFAKRTPGIFMLTSRIYTQLFGIGVVLQWRGFWLLEDIFFGMDVKSGVFTMLLGVVCLAALRGIRNIPNSPPFVFGPDEEGYYFYAPTRFNLKVPKSSLFTCFLDACLSVFIMESLIASSWRGLWLLLDLKLYPDDLTKSAVVSLATGYITAVFMYFTQYPASKISKHLGGGLSLTFENFWFLCASYATINAWRGWWLLTDLYLNLEVFNYWFIVFLSGWVVTALYCANNILARGILVDGSVPDGKAVLFPVAYLKKIIKVQDNTYSKVMTNGKVILIEKFVQTNSVDEKLDYV